MNACVHALAVDGSGNLFAGGEFWTAGGNAATNIAKWNGSAWSALGSGMNYQVYALALDGSGNLFAGGTFEKAGGNAANRIAKWNGSAWSALGSGMNNFVYALAVDGAGNLYAGGEFTTAGGKVSAYVAKAIIEESAPGIGVLGTNKVAIASDEAASGPKGTDFGSISWDQGWVHTFAITNAGTETLTISGLTTNGAGSSAFTILGMPSAVAGGSASNFTVTFSPSAVQTYAAVVAIANNSALTPFNLCLSGIGAKRDQTITFPAIPEQELNNALVLSATASSELPVSFAVDSGPGFIDGGTNLTFTGTGLVSIVATQAGNASWNAAPAILRTFLVVDAGVSRELAILSFDGKGALSFGTIPQAESYRIEWAPSPAGPWTNGWEASVDLPESGSGSVTCSVPMCYRVVAKLADYMVINLSGGTNASRYPVTYLNGPPPGGWTDEYKTTKLVLRQIPAGTFTMGSPAGELGRVSSETQHQVTLTKGYYIGVFEVTQRQWELVMGNRPSYFTNVFHYASRPVEQVSYEDIRGSSAGAGWPGTNAVDAASFMGKLRAKTGLATFDLPTEAQAEYACRAGTTNALNSGKNLTGTDSCPNVAEVGRYWFNGPDSYGYDQSVNTAGGSAKVGSYLPNAWGLYDMHGNVWEWCLDWAGTYPGTVNDPKGAPSGSSRLLRGGGWGYYANECRSAFRLSHDPTHPYYIDGFRVARILP
jgi:formylglycine-generating enzyme required for sulfatase activity